MTDNDEVERSYLDVFPSGGITFTPSQKHSLNLSSSRRINRPSYQDLNPFQNRLDELTFEQGNPS
ncbi:MAG: outer membrane beta-barrel protein [Haliscomenobacter sp.]|nr:outer membrane beta-barrel protein [Haliscomenobacter sp.]